MMQLRKNRKYTSNLYLPENWIVDSDIHIAGLGKFRSFGGFEYEQIANRYIMHIIHEGRGVCSYDGRDYELKKGELFAFLPGMQVHYYDYNDSPWEYHWLHFDGSKVKDYFDQLALSAESPYLCLSKYPDIDLFLSAFEKRIITKKYSNFYASKSAWTLLDLIASGESNKTVPLVNQIKNYIDSCEMQIPTVTGLSEVFNIDRSNLYRLFKNKFGVSVKEYIDTRRMQRICELLKTSSLSLERISEICAYNNVQYFSIAFKNKFGISPGKWRN